MSSKVESGLHFPAQTQLRLWLGNLVSSSKLKSSLALKSSKRSNYAHVSITNRNRTGRNRPLMEIWGNLHSTLLYGVQLPELEALYYY